MIDFSEIIVIFMAIFIFLIDHRFLSNSILNLKLKLKIVLNLKLKLKYSFKFNSNILIFISFETSQRYF